MSTADDLIAAVRAARQREAHALVDVEVADTAAINARDRLNAAQAALRDAEANLLVFTGKDDWRAMRP